MDSNDEGMIVVIVGDNDNDDDQKFVIGGTDEIRLIKQEVKEEADEELAIEELLERAEKHGEYIEMDIDQLIKQEPVNEEYIEDQFEDQYEDNEYLEGDDDIFIPNEEDAYDDDEEYIEPVKKEPKKRGAGAEKLRHAMLKPWQIKSFVKDLKADYPELAHNQKMLVDTLATIMRNVKAPPLPKVFCTYDNGQYTCNKCGHMADTIPAAGRHHQERHGERYLICYACGVDFRSKTNLYKHEKRCSAPDATVVLKARALFVGRKGRSRPFIPKKFTEPKKKKATKPIERKFCCPLCPAKFFSGLALRSHGFLHQGLRPFRCTDCPAAYTSPTALKRHSLKHTGIQFICDHCQRPFSTKAALVVHLNTHKPEKPFRCAECGKRYSQRAALRLHADRAHRRLPPPAACQICPRRYPRMSLLRDHMLKQHGMKLITKKMFLRALPNMTDEEHIEQAKLFYKTDEQRSMCSDTEPIEEEITLLQETETNQPETEEYTEIEIPVADENMENVEVFEVEDNEENNIELNEQLLEYVEKLKGDTSDVKFLCVRNGQLIEL